MRLEDFDRIFTELRSNDKLGALGLPSLKLRYLIPEV
jgi:hypothetical protein